MNNRGKRILVVDDSEEVRSLIAFLLAGEGYTVSEACDGEEALRRIKAEPFDVVVTDFQMPGLNGLEVMAHMREQDAQRPVIVVSGLDTDLSRCAVELGAYAWMSKPLSRPLFLDIVRSAVTAGQMETLPVGSPA
jgi:CheY-like chemotaxis protein